MVRKDYFLIILSGLIHALDAAIGCRWWVGQAGGEGARSTVTSLYRVRTAIAGGSGAAQVGTHYFDATSPNTAQAAADAVHAFWDSIKASINNTFTFQVEPAVESVDSTTGQPTGITQVTSTVVTGTSATAYLPSATQALVQWRTGFFLGGREIRGRTYVPGIISSAITNQGTPGPALVTALNTAASQIITWASSDFVVYSRRHHAIGLVNSGTPWTKFAVLRSRRD